MSTFIGNQNFQNQLFFKITFVLTIFSVVLFPTNFSNAQSSSSAPIGVAGRQQLHGHLFKELTNAPVIGNMGDSEQMNLAIELPLQNQAALQNLLTALYDPQNPQYRHFLTPSQFNAEFGPSQSDYESVMNFAQSHGLTVTKT